MKKTFKIKGMHCNSCAMLIEKELKDKVNSVSASYSKEEAEIDFDENKISENEIKEKIKTLGYEVIDKNQEKNTKSNYAEYKDFTQNKEEGFVDKIGLYVLLASVILLLFVVYYFFFRSIQLPEISIPQLGENTSLILLFAAGILTGFHCVSMCGAFVLSYATKNAQNGHKGYGQHLVYGGSKVVSYAIIGGLFGLIGGVIAFSIGLRSWVAVLAGLFMIFYALSMFGLKFFRRFQFNPKFLTKIAASESGKYKGPYSRPLVTGLLNGLFIACGPLQAMYLYAMGTGSFVSGATSLAAFGLGTLPVMLGFGSLATVISHKTTKKILKISAIIVLILGLIMLNRGLTLMGSPYSYSAISAKISGGSLSQANVNTGTVSGNSGVIIKDGIQEVNMDVDASGYHPNSFVLKKGVPVKWNVNVKQLTGCNSELVMNAYGIDLRLKQGLNTAEFTPDKTGTIQFSCGMGMLKGSFIVTETGTASQEEVKAATPPAGSTCSMGSGGGSCGCGM